MSSQHSDIGAGSSVWFNGTAEDLLCREIDTLRSRIVTLLEEIEALERVSRLQTQTILELNDKIAMLKDMVDLLQSLE